jgi:hypothetical protein
MDFRNESMSSHYSFSRVGYCLGQGFTFHKDRALYNVQVQRNSGLRTALVLRLCCDFWLLRVITQWNLRGIKRQGALWECNWVMLSTFLCTPEATEHQNSQSFDFS